ncbi:MAG: DUF393 domain-containing protein [Campylobacterales bacterium]|nr:DUF393 domain-containing protein [Campylobacterales bacterium]
MKHIILFDGRCNLCSKSVHFIMKRNKNQLYNYIALQSPQGEEYLKKYGFPFKEFDTVVLIEEENVYIKSTAILKIVKNLSGVVHYLHYFIYLPRFLRDFLYDVIAKTRYKLFGRKSCDVSIDKR